MAELTHNPDNCVWILDCASPRRALVATLTFGHTKDRHQSIPFFIRWVFGFDRRPDPEESELADSLRHGGDTVVFTAYTERKGIVLRGLMSQNDVISGVWL
jgi:hypothetical protein